MEKQGDLSVQDILENEKQAAMEKVASVYTGPGGQMVQDPYPTPYVTLSDMHIPNKMNELFGICKYYYTFDPLVTGSINALAAFPVTEVNLGESNASRKIKQEERDNSNTPNMQEEESEQLKLYKRVIIDKLNIHKTLVEMGIDYWLYGNCFIFGEFEKHATTGEYEWKHLVRLDPQKVIIDKNEATQELKYKWRIPNNIKRIVKNKKPRAEYDKIPELIKEAVNKNETLIINPNNIFHLSRPSDSFGDTSWGPPIIANVMKLLLYRNTLRQAQEAIAKEHIVPFRIYYFEQTPNYNPNADLSAVIAKFSTELAKAARDPNYKVVSGVPVNVINLGGQGKALMLTPEIEQVQAEILAGMGVPREFIFGGMSYSGSSISLKILENQFITFRLFIKDFLQNFLIKNMARARKEWKDDADNDNLPTIDMVEIKMQDDVQQKQLIITLNQTGKVPDETVWRVMGFDADEMRETLKEEAKKKIDLEEEIEILRIQSQGRIQMEQIKMQMEIQKMQAKLQADYTMSAENKQLQQVQMQDQAQQAQMQEQMQGQQQAEQEQQAQQQQAEQQQGQEQQQAQQQQEQQPLDQKQIQQVFAQIQQMPPAQALQQLAALKGRVPAPILNQMRQALQQQQEQAQAQQQQQEQEQAQGGQQQQQVSHQEAVKLAQQIMQLPENRQAQELAKLPIPVRRLVQQFIEQMQQNQGGGEQQGGSTDMRAMPTQRPPRRNSMK